MDRPVCPRARLVRYSSLDARAVEWPEYVRMTQERSLSRCTWLMSSTLLPAVVVEAGAALAAQLLGAHHAAQQRHRRVVGIAELGVQRVEDGETHVETDQVEEG